MRFWLIGVGVLVLAACNRTQETTPSPFKPETLAQGRDLFQAHCAQCHGPEAQGHPDWQTPNDGTFSAAPPLNGTGNEHLRSKQQLIATIKQGVKRDGVDVMPSWGERLSDGEIEAMVVWLQSLWPPQTYQAWLKAQADVRPPQGNSP